MINKSHAYVYVVTNYSVSKKNMPTKEDSLLTFRGQIMHKNLERVHQDKYDSRRYEYTSYLDDSNLGSFSLNIYYLVIIVDKI